MAEERTPDDSGTSEEQDEDHRLEGAEPAEQQGPTDEDGDGLAVQAVDEAEDEQADSSDDSMDMAEQMAEAQEYLEGFDPDNVAACALVVSLKETATHPDGEEADGLQWRVLNPDLEGYEDTRDVLTTIVEFNDALENSTVLLEKPSGPQMLGGLLEL